MGIQLRRMMARRSASGDSRLGPRRLLQRGGGVPADRLIVVQQHDRHGVAQHLVRRKREFGGHEAAQHRRQHRAGVLQRMNDLERRGHHRGEFVHEAAQGLQHLFGRPVNVLRP